MHYPATASPPFDQVRVRRHERPVVQVAGWIADRLTGFGLVAGWDTLVVARLRGRLVGVGLVGIGHRALRVAAQRGARGNGAA